jgi:hypothetical protein
MRIVVLSALFGVAACSMALAEPSDLHSAPTAPAPPMASSQVPNPHEVICRNRIATGSRLAYARDCHTRAEWESITRSSQDFIQRVQSRGLTTNNCPAGGSNCSH